MKIHTVKHGEELSKIARIYDTPQEVIRRDNELGGGDEPAPGEELLIKACTRVHKVRYGDSISKLAIRFRVRESDLLALNPYIGEHGITLHQK